MGGDEQPLGPESPLSRALRLDLTARASQAGIKIGPTRMKISSTGAVGNASQRGFSGLTSGVAVNVLLG
jgi:hypothetical protein